MELCRAIYNFHPTMYTGIAYIQQLAYRLLVSISSRMKSEFATR